MCNACSPSEELAFWMPPMLYGEDIEHSVDALCIVCLVSLVSGRFGGGFVSKQCTNISQHHTWDRECSIPPRDVNVPFRSVIWPNFRNGERERRSKSPKIENGNVSRSSGLRNGTECVQNELEYVLNVKRYKNHLKMLRKRFSQQRLHQFARSQRRCVLHGV